MAATERVTLIKPDAERPSEGIASPDFPGLTVLVRTTTSSFSDYPDWSLDELLSQRRNAIVTDGSCS